MSYTLKEALKEALRLIVLAMLPVAVVYVSEANPAWAGVALVILRAVDKWLHEIGKEMDATPDEAPMAKFLMKGLTRF